MSGNLVVFFSPVCTPRTLRTVARLYTNPLALFQDLMHFLKKRFLVMFRTKRSRPRCAVASAEDSFPLSGYVGWRQNCGVQCLYIVVQLQTNTGWHGMAKGVKAPLLVATIQ